jgi:phage recombination protein Bet
MSNEIVKYQWQDKEISLSSNEIRNLISTDPNVTDKEILLFMQLCKYQNLNPFVREAYLIKYGSYPASMVVGKEVFTKRAEMNPDFDGYEISDNYKSKMDLNDFEVTCQIYRKNLSHPISVTVSYPEYVGTDAKGNVNRMWNGKPRTMLRKVALMQALREAFPTALGGLYEENELDQQEIPKDITQETVEQPEPKPKAKAPAESATSKGEALTEKQQNYIKSHFLNSSYLTKEEVADYTKEFNEGMGKKRATELIRWWIGDKEKNIAGEREKREIEQKVEKQKKNGNNDLEYKGELMQAAIDLFKENHIDETDRKRFYQNFQKNKLQELETEELVQLVAMIKEYVPEW